MIISPNYKFKYYKVRFVHLRSHNKDEWQRIYAKDARDAAEGYAEEHGLCEGSKVSVRGAGIFVIDVERLYHAHKS